MTADDYFAIQNLLYRYCDRLDRGDLDGMAKLFANADVYLPADPEPIRDRRASRRCTSVHAHLPGHRDTKTRHVTTNVMIEPEGETRRARSRT
jgi:hypothetical protein